jgi:hypothetical protein
MALMRALAARLDVVATVAILMVAMLLVMWASHPTVTCSMPHEAVRQLILTRDIDREHLSRDRLEAERIARLYTASQAGSPEHQGDVDACEATLAREIVATHGVTADQARR